MGQVHSDLPALTIFATGGIAAQKIVALGMPGDVQARIAAALIGSDAELVMNDASPKNIEAAREQTLAFIAVLNGNSDGAQAISAIQSVIEQADAAGEEAQLGRYVVLTDDESRFDDLVDSLDPTLIDYSVVGLAGLSPANDGPASDSPTSHTTATGVTYEPGWEPAAEPLNPVDFADFIISFIAQPTAFSRDRVFLR